MLFDLDISQLELTIFFSEIYSNPDEILYPLRVQRFSEKQ